VSLWQKKVESKNPIFELLQVDKLIENISGYIETRLELFKLDIQEGLAKILANLAFFSILLLLILIVLIFISMSVGFYLNKVLDSSFWGFGIVASFYLLLLILFILFSKKNMEVITSHIQKIIDKNLSNNQNNDKPKNN